MEKFKHLIFGVVAFMFGALAVSAAECNYSELSEISKEASGVKITYEESKRELPGDNGVADIDDGNNDTVYEYYLTVKITNVTDNLYIKVTNPIDNSVKVLSSGDANNGVISFPWYDLDNVNNLSIKVYTSTKTSCPNQEVLTTSKTLPMYNYYSTTPYCEKHPNEKICKKYVESEVTSDQFYKVVDKNNKDAVDKANDTGVISNVTNFVSKNKKGFIIGGSIIIVMGVVTTAVVIIKRRRSRLI